MRGICAITPPALRGRELLDNCRAALEGGVAMLQLRFKARDSAEVEGDGRALRKLAREFGALLIINDDADLALELEADGLHVGAEDIPVAEARKRGGPRFIVGATCGGSLERGRQAANAGADYVSFGALYPSSTKPGAAPCGFGIYAEFGKSVPAVPTVAIGGITPANAQEAAGTGASMLAVCAGLFGAPDITIAAKQLTEAFYGKRTVG